MPWPLSFLLSSLTWGHGLKPCRPGDQTPRACSIIMVLVRSGYWKSHVCLCTLSRPFADSRWGQTGLCPAESQNVSKEVAPHLFWWCDLILHCNLKEEVFLECLLKPYRKTIWGFNLSVMSFPWKDEIHCSIVFPLHFPTCPTPPWTTCKQKPQPKKHLKHYRTSVLVQASAIYFFNRSSQ